MRSRAIAPRGGADHSSTPTRRTGARTPPTLFAFLVLKHPCAAREEFIIDESIACLACSSVISSAPCPGFLSAGQPVFSTVSGHRVFPY
jgi:hypothetical protein